MSPQKKYEELTTHKNIDMNVQWTQNDPKHLSIPLKLFSQFIWFLSTKVNFYQKAWVLEHLMRTNFSYKVPLAQTANHFNTQSTLNFTKLHSVI